MTEYRTIELGSLLAMAMERRAKGDRLVQIHCSRGAQWEIIYSFDGPEGFVHYKVQTLEKPMLKSISDFFPPAYLYENEISELFGLTIEGMIIDFKGNLYNPQKKSPFNLMGDGACAAGSELGLGGVSPGKRAMEEAVAAATQLASAIPAANEKKEGGNV